MKTRKTQRAALPIVAAFDCPRTCRQFERRDICRFNPLLRLLGVRAAVHSHTVKVQADFFGNPPALRRAVENMGGQFLGFGQFELFESGTHAGYGFRLPGWRYPLVANTYGTVAFDDYRGQWGNPADMAILKAEYASAAAELAAQQLGWMTQRNQGGGLTVFHPSGGTLTIDAAGTVDALGFNGIGCHDAALAMAAAIGRPVETTIKPEYAQQRQQLNQLE